LKRGNSLIAIPFAFIALFPVLWAFLSSFKSLKDIVSPVPVLFFRPTFQNYVDVLATPAVQMGVMNSIIVVSSAVAIGILFGWPAAYALARLTGRVKEELLFYVLSIRFMPPVAIAIPFMAIYLDLGLNDTYLALILTYSLVTISTIIWMSIPAFENVPLEIEEAAELDGYGQLAVFWKIALPSAAASLIGGVLFTFVIIWNELLIALVLTARDVTLPVVASSFSTLGMEVPWGIINASAILLCIPPFLFMGLLTQFLNRFFQPKSTL
jgi:multiple sugar transport system permease protein